jgi:hypothetical protein
MMKGSYLEASPPLARFPIYVDAFNESDGRLLTGL